MLLDQILINLKVVSKLENYEKITVGNDGNITIQKTGVIQTVTRIVKGDSRDISIDIINQIISNVIEMSEYIIEYFELIIKLNNEKKTINNLKKIEEKYNYLVLIIQELKNSIKGINNLYNTYSHDPRISSRVDYIRSNIESYISKLEEKIKIFSEFQKKNNNML